MCCDMFYCHPSMVIIYSIYVYVCMHVCVCCIAGSYHYTPIIAKHLIFDNRHKRSCIKVLKKIRHRQKSSYHFVFSLLGALTEQDFMPFALK